MDIKVIRRWIKQIRTVDYQVSYATANGWIDGPPDLIKDLCDTLEETLKECEKLNG